MTNCTILANPIGVWMSIQLQSWNIFLSMEWESE